MKGSFIRSEFVELLSVLILMILLVSILSNTVYALSTELMHFEQVDTAMKFIRAIVPASSIPQIIGSKISNLVVASCINGELILGDVKIVPRAFQDTFFATLNATVSLPVIGDDVVLPNDLLIISIPIVENNQYISKCKWGTLTAKMRLHNRVLVNLYGGYIFDTNGVKKVQRPIYFYLYYDFNVTTFFSGDPKIDMELLNTISQILGLEQVRASNRWLKTFRAKALEKASVIRIEYAEFRKAFVLDPSTDQIIKEIGSDQEVFAKALSTISTNSNWVIDNSGGPSRWYHFSLIILNKSLISTIERKIYMGAGIYSVVLYTRANSTSSSTSATLRIAIEIWNITNLNNPKLYWSIVKDYSLSATPQDIYIYPSIPYDNNLWNITVEFQWIGGAQPYVALAVLNIYKIWDQMPIPQTQQAVQILSMGTSWIRDPVTGSFPSNCPCSGSASNLLHSSSYGKPLGLIMYSPGSITVDGKMLNGVFYDSLYESSPKTKVDVCVMNKYTRQINGWIAVKINGVTYANKSITVSPAIGDRCAENIGIFDQCGWGVASFSFFFTPGSKGGGPLITVEHNLTTGDSLNDLYLLIDIVIEYSYAPEVWKPDNLLSWNRKSAYSKAMMYEFKYTTPKWASSIVVESSSAQVGGSNYVRAVHKTSIFKPKMPGDRVLTSGLSLKIPKTFSIGLPGCALKYYGTNYEEYIGLATTAYGILTTGYEILSLIGAVTSIPVSAGIFIAGLVIITLQASTSFIDVQISDEGNYYVVSCYWNAGSFTYYEWTRLQLDVPLDPLNAGNFELYVSAIANDDWVLKERSFTITIVQYFSGVAEPYSGFYNRPGYEVIYD